MNPPELREFPHLSPMAFQHPADVQAVANLQRIPLLAPVLKTISGSIFEKQLRLLSISSAIRLGPKQGRSVYQKFEKAATILDLPELPEIYVSSHYMINAVAFGLDKYQIVLFGGLIDLLTEAELQAVIGHELGHVKCQHMLYKTIVYILRFFGAQALYNLLPAGTATLATIPLQLAILEWERKAELSCDRAALLVAQEPDVVASALAKLAGGAQKILPEINLDEILHQAQEYNESSEGVVEQLFKVSLLLQQTHPFPIVRANEIIAWSKSEQYQQILQGNYVRAESSPDLTVTEGMGKVCPKCERTANASATICLGCGSSLKGARFVCSNCHIKVFSTWQTCPRCGQQLQAVPPAVVADVR
jgi:Zn-dependent protease with chaperone function